MDQHNDNRGARIGTRIAHLISQAIIYTHRGLLDVKHKLAVMIFNTITNEISDEVDTTIGPLLKKMAADYDENGHAAALMNFMAHGRGQFKAIVGSSAAGQSLLWALSTVISNELAPLSYNIISTSPHLVPDPATIAQFAAMGLIGEDTAIYDIAKNGYGGDWTRRWIEAQKQYASPVDASDMVHKGIINNNTYDDWMSRQAFPREVADAYYEASYQPASMQDAALAFLRGAIDQNELYDIAKKSGFLQDAVNVYLETIGEPPGTQDMLEGWRRGFISESTLERGILQSRVRNEWIPLIKELRYSPMSVADAVNAAVQNHISQDQARKIADENGLLPGQYDTLYETAGAPLSRTELNDLYNRGEIGSDVVIQGLRESRLKDKYGKDAFALRRRLLEPRSLGEAVAVGAITHDEAIKKAMEHGFTKEDATTLVGAASNRKMLSYKEHITVQVETLYMDGAYSQQEALTAFEKLGHSPEEAGLIVQTADYKREQRAFASATNAIRSRLIARHIDKAEASNLLDGIGMRATQRDYLLNLWVLEESANVRVLTPAQVLRAIKIGSITPEDGAVRLTHMGYSDEDAALLILDI